jgi:PAS domain S-box-containing protein
MENLTGEWLSMVLNSVTDEILILDREFRFTFINASARKDLTQRCEAERNRLLGRVLWEALPDLLGTIAEEKLRQAMETRVSNQYEIGFRDHWYDICVCPINDGGLALFARDFTKIKRAEENLRHSEERLRMAFDVAYMGTYQWDIATGKVEWSGYLEPMHGLVPGTFGGTFEAFRELIHPEDRERVVQTIFHAVRQRAVLNCEFRVVWPDRSVHWILSKGKVLLDADGEPSRMIGVCMDVTDQREAEEALQGVLQLRQQADRRKDEFLSMLAHELRNPLAPIRNAVEVLRQLCPAEPRFEWARDVIDRQVRGIVRLVDDLLDISRITLGKLSLHKEEVDLQSVVSRAVEISGPLIDARRHRLSVSLPSEPVRLIGDLPRLAQAVSNLLINAAKFTPEGGRIWVDAGLDNGDLVLQVRDTGIGIPKERLSSIFDLYTQIVPQEGNHVQSGLGIGLKLVRSLVEMHGGKVEAESDGIGRGSCFRMRLPTVAEAIPDPGNHPKLPDDRSSGICRILVVDDSMDTAKSLALFLEIKGHEVRVAHNGPDALHLSSNFRPHLILLDIGLPGMDGYQVAQQLRSREETRDAILVALTGYGQEKDRQRARDAGFDYHFIKPVDPKALDDFIASLH